MVSSGKRFAVRLRSLKIERWDRWQPQIERHGVRHISAERPNGSSLPRTAELPIHQVRLMPQIRTEKRPCLRPMPAPRVSSANRTSVSAPGRGPNIVRNARHPEDNRETVALEGATGQTRPSPHQMEDRERNGCSPFLTQTSFQRRTRPVTLLASRQ